jgi:hypothetical protein
VWLLIYQLGEKWHAEAEALARAKELLSRTKRHSV